MKAALQRNLMQQSQQVSANPIRIILANLKSREILKFIRGNSATPIKESCEVSEKRFAKKA